QSAGNDINPGAWRGLVSLRAVFSEAISPLAWERWRLLRRHTPPPRNDIKPRPRAPSRRPFGDDIKSRWPRAGSGIRATTCRWFKKNLLPVHYTLFFVTDAGAQPVLGGHIRDAQVHGKHHFE